jgi:hypothetical protein
MVYVVCVVGVKGNVQLAFHPVALNTLILNPEAAGLPCPRDSEVALDCPAAGAEVYETGIQ